MKVIIEGPAKKVKAIARFAKGFRLRCEIVEGAGDETPAPTIEEEKGAEDLSDNEMEELTINNSEESVSEELIVNEGEETSNDEELTIDDESTPKAEAHDMLTSAVLNKKNKKKNTPKK